MKTLSNQKLAVDSKQVVRGRVVSGPVNSGTSCQGTSCQWNSSQWDQLPGDQLPVDHFSGDQFSRDQLTRRISLNIWGIEAICIKWILSQSSLLYFVDLKNPKTLMKKTGANYCCLTCRELRRSPAWWPGCSWRRPPGRWSCPWAARRPLSRPKWNWRSPRWWSSARPPGTHGCSRSWPENKRLVFKNK